MPPTSISNVLLQSIEAHVCLCRDCAPKYHEDLEDGVMREAQTIREAGVAEETRDEVQKRGVVPSIPVPSVSKEPDTGQVLTHRDWFDPDEDDEDDGEDYKNVSNPQYILESEC